MQNQELNTYKEVENRFFDCLKDLCGDALIFYCVTGSYGRKDIVRGWSDIDILLVFETYDPLIFSHIHKALKTNASLIKIGLTIYSIFEFSHESLKDPKTLQALKLIQEEVFSPRIYIKERIKIKIPSQSILDCFDQVDFTKILQEIKRELIKGDSFDEVKTFKAAILLIKLLLRKKGIHCLGYENIINNSKKIKNLTVTLVHPRDILRTPELKQERYNMYVELLHQLERIIL